METRVTFPLHHSLPQARRAQQLLAGKERRMRCVQAEAAAAAELVAALEAGRASSAAVATRRAAAARDAEQVQVR